MVEGGCLGRGGPGGDLQDDGGKSDGGGGGAGDGGSAADVGGGRTAGGSTPAKRRGEGKLKHPMDGAPPAEGSRAEDLAAAATLRDLILELLKKRGMTSKEVIDATGATAALCTSNFRVCGRIAR